MLKINEMVTNSFFLFFFNQKSVKNNTGDIALCGPRMPRGSQCF